MSSNLADILDATPRRRVEFDMSRVDIGQLTLIELLDAGEASGIPFEDFRANLLDPSKQAYLFYALAWVIMRRVEPDLTFDDVCQYDLIVTGEMDEAQAERTAKRARSTVAVAAIAKVSPQEAEQMTISQIDAAIDLQQRRNRAQRRKR